ncbi:hypothetical protein N7527_008476, partial [Penicillium freii]
RQIDYLVYLTKPFFQFTIALIKTRDITIYTRQKLKEYYKKTYRNYGFLYSTRTLLASYTFDNREYLTYYKNTSKRYYKYLRYQQQNPELLFYTVQRSSNLYSIELNQLLELPKYTVVETGRSSIHRHIHEPEQEEESIEEDIVDYDEADLLPPPIIQLSDRSQKRSSSRVTIPSSRLRGYKVY